MLGSLFGNFKELPKPLGKYVVGIVQLDFSDRNRTKVFPFEEDNAQRKIPITIFYPAKSNGGKDSAPYASSELLEVLSNMTLGLVSKNVAKVKTNCYENVPIAVNEDKYPVIIFNHGYGGYTMQSTVLCSDLASSGYVVISIGHPYESSGIKYLDGSVIKMPKSIQKNVRNSSILETYKHLRRVVKASTKEYYSDSQAMQLSEQFLENYPELNKNVKIWVDDSIFIAEQLEALNKGETESIFRNKLKLDLGIGITGHSYGGATAAQACLVDRRFVAGINIDGASCGDFTYKDIKKPFMLLGTHLIKNISRTTYIYNTEDTYMAILDDTQHLGYSDGLFIFRQANLINQIGRREKYTFREIVTNCHLKFFEIYLLRNQEVELKDLRYDGFEFRQRLSKN